MPIKCYRRYPDGMTRKISISVPDDVADTLDGVPNASAYIAEAVRLRRRRDTTRGILKNAGYDIAPERVAAMRARVEHLEARRAARKAGTAA